jgi:hypothetical protein
MLRTFVGLSAFDSQHKSQRHPSHHGRQLTHQGPNLLNREAVVETLSILFSPSSLAVLSLISGRGRAKAEMSLDVCNEHSKRQRQTALPQ